MKDTKKVLHENEPSDDFQADTPSNSQGITEKLDEIKTLLNQASSVIVEVGQWSESTAQLFSRSAKKPSCRKAIHHLPTFAYSFAYYVYLQCVRVCWHSILCSNPKSINRDSGVLIFDGRYFNRFDILAKTLDTILWLPRNDVSIKGGRRCHL